MRSPVFPGYKLSLCSMVSDKCLNVTLERVLLFYFKNYVNMARILQMFSIAI